MSSPRLVLPSRRCLTFTAAIYLLVICALTLPRVVGPSWRSMITPMAMRNLEGYPVQWEAYLVLRSLYAMSTDTTPDDLIEWYSTDEYRAILPIYFAAIITQITNRYIIGVTISDVIWWWLGTIGVFLLVRNYAPTTVSFGAGLLTCFSPLGVGHIGSAHLHTASSLSLSLSLAVTYDILFNRNLKYFFAVLSFGCCLFLSSITYTYQWFIIPFAFVVCAMPSFSKRRLRIWASGTVVFLILRWSSYGILALGQLSVHSHQNDPVRVLIYSIENQLISVTPMGIAIGFLFFLIDKCIVISHMFVTSYGELVLVAAVIGAVYVRNTYERVVLVAGVSLSVSFGAIYGIPWVIMSAYPMVYAMASRGSYQLHRIALASLPAGRFQILRTPRVILATQVILIAAIGMSTNLDVFGDPTFSVRWWQGSYIPH